MEHYTIQQQQQMEQQAYEQQQYDQQQYEQQLIAQEQEQQQYLQQQYEMQQAQQQQIGFGLQLPQLNLLQPQPFQFQPAPAFNFGFPMGEAGGEQQQPLLQLPQTNSFVAANAMPSYPFVFYPDPEVAETETAIAASSPTIAKKTRDASVKKGKKKAKSAMCNCFA